LAPRRPGRDRRGIPSFRQLNPDLHNSELEQVSWHQLRPKRPHCVSGNNSIRQFARPWSSPGLILPRSPVNTRRFLSHQRRPPRAMQFLTAATTIASQRHTISAHPHLSRRGPKIPRHLSLGDGGRNLPFQHVTSSDNTSSARLQRHRPTQKTADLPITGNSRHPLAWSATRPIGWSSPPTTSHPPTLPSRRSPHDAAGGNTHIPETTTSYAPVVKIRRRVIHNWLSGHR